MRLQGKSCPLNSDLSSINPSPPASRASALSRYYVKPIILARGINRGERISVLMDRVTRTPVTAANEYMFDAKRLLRAANTYFRNLSAIGLAYEWSNSRNIVLASRLFSGVGFTTSELSSLFAHIRERRRPNKRGAALVGKTEQRARIVAIRDFVLSSMRDAEFNLDPRKDAEKLSVLDNRIDMTRALFKQFTPQKERSPRKKGLTQKSILRLVEVIVPDHPTNPWKDNPAVRYRNFILVMLLLVTGGRRGDVAKLKIIDIVAGPQPFIRFNAHTDDPADTRISEPRLKTQPREYPVDADIVAAVANYIEHHRSQIPNSVHSEYLFLDTKRGRPLSQRSINAIFERLQASIPGLTPHILRHTNTEQLTKNAKAHGVGKDEMLRAIMYLNGWVSDNLETYTAREQEDTARLLATSRQAGFFEK